jgi:hypothetical protein
MNREKAALIDVSEPREFGASHAAQARNVPIGQLETSKDLPSNKALPLVVVLETWTRVEPKVFWPRSTGPTDRFAPLLAYVDPAAQNPADG